MLTCTEVFYHSYNNIIYRDTGKNWIREKGKGGQDRKDGRERKTEVAKENGSKGKRK